MNRNETGCSGWRSGCWRARASPDSPPGRVAAGAATSAPAVYELFEDKAGLVREVFFEGFRLLRRYLDTVPATDDPRSDLIAVAGAYRRFARDNPVLTDVMFSRPFADFDPAPAEAEAGRAVREFVVGRVQRAIGTGLLQDLRE